MKLGAPRKRLPETLLVVAPLSHLPANPLWSIMAWLDSIDRRRALGGRVSVGGSPPGVHIG